MEEIGLILDAVLPPFAIVAIGWLLQRLRRLDPAPIIDAAMYVAVPCLAYYAIIQSSMPPSEIGGITLCAAGTLLGSGLLGWAGLRLVGIRSRGLLIPITFMNAANLPLPITHFLWGDDGMARAVVYYLVVLVCMYTVGIAMACGRTDWKRLLREPAIWATLAAILVKALGWETPRIIWRGVGLLQAAAIPLILIVLGMQLREVRRQALPISVYASALRMLGGLGLGFILVAVFEVQGLARDVVILMSGMPSAMISAAIAARYDSDADLVAATVMTSTLAATIFLPLVLYFLT